MTNCEQKQKKYHVTHQVSLSTRSTTTTSKLSTLTITFFLVLLLLMIVGSHASTIYSMSDNDIRSDLDDYSDNLLAKMISRSMDISNNKRYLRRENCLRRGASCDARVTKCCPDSTCRCNLWGTNCRCQRLGLFQRWG